MTWDIKQLKKGTDPLGLGICAMFEKGAKNALFLPISSAPAGSKVPHFVANAAIGPSQKLRIWTGLKWDPTVMPEVWNLFVRAGFVELSPPGAATNIKSNRNVVRAAFGVEPSEWLLLVRTGPSNACRGVLALISDKSIITEVAAAQKLLAAPAPVKKAG